MTVGIEPLPQPRIDSIVIDAVTGQQRRQTEYTGTVWFGVRPQITGAQAITSVSSRLETPFFLPDSLPYILERAGDAVVASTIAAQTTREDPWIIEHHAGLVPDPRGGELAWLQLQIHAVTQLPLGVSYRIVVRVALDAVAGGGDG